VAEQLLVSQEGLVSVELVTTTSVDRSLLFFSAFSHLSTHVKHVVHVININLNKIINRPGANETKLVLPIFANFCSADNIASRIGAN
jgi:hypothetical protein